MIKLNLTLDKTNWLEATWIEEAITKIEVDKVETGLCEDRISTNTLWCESFSGHREHIAMLRARALEFGTSLDEYESLIAECESKFVYPTDEEIATETIANQVQEYKSYLKSTDYKMTIDYFSTLSEVEQNDLITKRAQAREYVRLNEGVK